eukprot:scaffold446985_cov31-Prasinocladus_malaysianus.AAC.1
MTVNPELADSGPRPPAVFWRASPGALATLDSKPSVTLNLNAARTVPLRLRCLSNLTWIPLVFLYRPPRPPPHVPTARDAVAQSNPNYERGVDCFTTLHSKPCHFRLSLCHKLVV